MGFTTLGEAQLHQARKFMRKLVGQCLLVVSSVITENLDTDADINFYREFTVIYQIYSSPTLLTN
jgi:hypothetical protein